MSKICKTAKALVINGKNYRTPKYAIAAYAEQMARRIIKPFGTFRIAAEEWQEQESEWWAFRNYIIAKAERRAGPIIERYFA